MFTKSVTVPLYMKEMCWPKDKCNKNNKSTGGPPSMKQVSLLFLVFFFYLAHLEEECKITPEILMFYMFIVTVYSSTFPMNLN